MSNTSTTINAQTPGPLWLDDDFNLAAGSGDDYRMVADPRCMEPNGNEAEIDANALLLVAAFNAFDRAGRELGIDAAELAERIDLAELIRALAGLRSMVGNVLTDSQLDRPQLGGARAKCAQTIRGTLDPIDAILASLPTGTLAPR